MLKATNFPKTQPCVTQRGVELSAINRLVLRGRLLAGLQTVRKACQAHHTDSLSILRFYLKNWFWRAFLLLRPHPRHVSLPTWAGACSNHNHSPSKHWSNYVLILSLTAAMFVPSRSCPAGFGSRIPTYFLYTQRFALAWACGVSYCRSCQTRTGRTTRAGTGQKTSGDGSLAPTPTVHAYNQPKRDLLSMIQGRDGREDVSSRLPRVDRKWQFGKGAGKRSVPPTEAFLLLIVKDRSHFWVMCWLWSCLFCVYHLEGIHITFQYI